MSLRKITLALAALCISAPTFAQSPAHSLGPIQIGMSVDQLRAATPGTSWTTLDRWPNSGRPKTVQADAVLTLGDMPMRVRAMPGYHGQYHALLTGFSTQPNAEACQASLIGVANALGTMMARGKPSTYRPFAIAPFLSSYARYDGDRTSGRWNASAWPRPGSWRPSFVETQLKSVLEKAEQGSGSFVLQASEMASKTGDLTILFYGGWQAGGASGNVCSAEVKIDRRYETPPPKLILPFAQPLELLPKLTIAETLQLHEVLPRDGNGKTIVELDCGLTIASRTLADCRSRSRNTVAAAYSDLAVTLSQLQPIVLSDFSAFDLDDDVRTTRVAVQLVIDGARRSPLDFLSVPTIKAKEFASFAIGKAPPRPRDNGGKGTLIFKCQVQEDISTFCKPIKSEPAGLVSRYGHRAGAYIGKITVSPNLISGASAVGAVFEHRVAFQ